MLIASMEGPGTLDNVARLRGVFHMPVSNQPDARQALEDLELAFAEQDMAQLLGLASRLAGLSEQVGLADFARVARDLRACIEAEDPIATGAVAARLLRLGEDSLFSVMLYADQSAL